MFFWNSLAFSMIQRMLAIWSYSSAFSKYSLNIWKFSVHMLLKPSLENYEHYFVSMWHECNCAIVWTFFGIAFLWDQNENWPFPVVMYGCENWNIKKADYWRIDAFELWCWRRLLRIPWIEKRSNQLVLMKISSEYSLEGLMLMMKCQYFGHLMQRTN